VTRSKLILLLVVGLLLSLLVSWVAGGVLVSPARVVMPAVPEGAVAVYFGTESDSLIHGWFFPTPNPSASLVLMHGVRGNRTDMTQRAEIFRKLGFSVLTFDFQAHGESPGDAITFGGLESRDAIAAVRYVRAQAPDLPVVALGVSLGGASAVLAGSRLDADVLVIESVYSTIEQAVANRLNLRIPKSGVLAKLLLWQLNPRLGIRYCGKQKLSIKLFQRRSSCMYLKALVTRIFNSSILRRIELLCWSLFAKRLRFLPARHLSRA